MLCNAAKIWPPLRRLQHEGLLLPSCFLGQGQGARPTFPVRISWVYKTPEPLPWLRCSPCWRSTRSLHPGAGDVNPSQRSTIFIVSP